MACTHVLLRLSCTLCARLGVATGVAIRRNPSCVLPQLSAPAMLTAAAAIALNFLFGHRSLLNPEEQTGEK